MTASNVTVGVNFTLAILYLIGISLIVVLFYLKFKRKEILYSSTWFCVACLSLLSTLRIGYLFIITYLSNYHHHCVPYPINFWFSSCPGIFMYAAFLSIVTLWGELYVASYLPTVTMESSPLLSPRDVRARTSKEIRTLRIGLTTYLSIGMCFIFASFTYFTVANGMSCDLLRADIEADIFYIVAGLYLTVFPIMIGFLVFGYKLHVKYGMNTRRDTTQRATLIKVGIVVIICLIAFFLRSLALIIDAAKWLPRTVWTDAFYYFFLEYLFTYLLSCCSHHHGNTFNRISRTVITERLPNFKTVN